MKVDIDIPKMAIDEHLSKQLKAKDNRITSLERKNRALTSRVSKLSAQLEGLKDLATKVDEFYEITRSLRDRDDYDGYI